MGIADFKISNPSVCEETICPVCGAVVIITNYIFRNCNNCNSSAYMQYDNIIDIEIPLQQYTELFIDYKHKKILISINNKNGIQRHVLELNWIESDIKSIIEIAIKKLKNYLPFI
jgi:hypothetical protein